MIFRSAQLPFDIDDYEIQNGVLSGFNDINFHVGIINSGKSRFARELLKCKNDKYLCFDYWKLLELKKEISNTQLKPTKFGNNSYPHSFDVKNMNHMNTVYNIYKNLNEQFKKGHSIFFTNSYGSQNYAPSFSQYVEIQKIFEKYDRENFFALGSEKLSTNRVVKRIIIPSLRNLRRLTTEDSIAEILNSQYNFESTVEIFSGQTFYEKLDKDLRTSKETRENLTKFENFLSENFFDSKSITLIPEYRTENVLVKIGDEEYKIYQLGEGIQSIIILSYLPFMYKQQDCVFVIEEPENSLHQGFHRKFLKSLQLNNENHQYHIITHSNHILDLTSINTSKVSYFRHYKDKKNIKHITILEDDMKVILSDLQISYSSVLLTPCTIWVEGKSDIIYIRHLLKMFCENTSIDIEEDKDFSFATYGGNSITTYLFSDDSVNLKKFKDNNYFVFDGDVIKDKENWVEILNATDIDYKIWDFKTIEDVIPFEALEAFFEVDIGLSDQDVPIEYKIDDENYGYGSIAYFCKKAYDENPKFLEKSKKKSFISIKNEGATVNDFSLNKKVIFANAILGSDIALDKYPQHEAKDIVDFIISNRYK